jgi:hypothetical protein
MGGVESCAIGAPSVTQQLRMPSTRRSFGTLVCRGELSEEGSAPQDPTRGLLDSVSANDRGWLSAL